MAVLSLSRIFLYNWHRFSNHLLPLTGNLYLTGENGSGKSTILDALQLVLIGDLAKIHFNQAAQNERSRSSRNLSTYVLGKNDETYLRTTNTIAYVVLEFSDDEQQEYRCAGVCIEAGADKSYERTYFLLSEELSPDLFIPDGKPLRRDELRNLLRNRRAAGVYDQGEIKRYQAELLNRLGGLHDLFFELLGQALTFKPINNIHEFVSKMILPAIPIELKTMQEAQRNIQEVEALAAHVSQRIEELQKIVKQQQDIHQLQQKQEMLVMVQDILRKDDTQRNAMRLNRLIAARQRELDENEGQLQEVKRLLDEAEQQRDRVFQKLAQSDKEQRDLLIRTIEDEKKQLQVIEERWERLQSDLHTLSDRLGAVLDTDFLFSEEQQSLTQVLTAISQIMPGIGIAQGNIGIITGSLTFVNTIQGRIQERLSALSREVKALREQGNDLEQEKVQLERENRVRYHSKAIALQNLMVKRLGIRPTFLCELLDIPDPLWQDAVEAQLGMRRYALIVPPERFNEALVVLDDARATEHIYNIRLLNIEAIRAMSPPRALRAESLAYKVETTDPAVRTYINMVLGNVMTCESREQLRQYRHAITPRLLTYNEASAYAIDPDSFKPLCIGSRAKRLRLEDIDRELGKIGEKLSEYAPKITTFEEGQKSVGTIYRLLLTIQPTFKEPLDTQLLLSRIQDHERHLQSLDLTAVQALEKELEDWREEVKRLRNTEGEMGKKRSTIDFQKGQYEEERQKNLEVLESQMQIVEAHASKHADLFDEATQFRMTLAKSAISEAMSFVEQEQTSLQSEINKKVIDLSQVALTYNMSYAFRARIDIVVEETAFKDELQRLEETELPYQQELIVKVRRETENQLRQDILHRITEQFENVSSRFNRINAILGITSFHDKRYRLVHTVKEAEREYYDIIRASDMLGDASLYETQFYRDHQEACERFFDALLKTPQNDDERIMQERLVDYRYYFEYDILISDLLNPGYQPTSLAKTLHQRSGGETQTPFYVAIAASFASLYKVGEKNRRSSIRLVIFDEAFSKMDQRYIGSTLEVFRRFGLQIITATPPDRCPYLGPRMDTSLVLVLQGNTVRVEPLRRYLAALEEMP